MVATNHSLHSRQLDGSQDIKFVRYFYMVVEVCALVAKFMRELYVMCCYVKNKLF